MKRKQMAILAAFAACVAGTAFADTLDLAGVDRTVTDVAQLAAYDGVTNSSETLATLTFNLVDGEVQSYGGVISGNIRLVKLGSKSKLALTAANTYTGGTQIGTAGTAGGVIIVGNARACGDVAKSVEIKSRAVANGSNPEIGPWCTLQIDASGFANPIILPTGTDEPRRVGNTFIDHSLCVTNGGISIESPISGGRFTFLAANTYSKESGSVIAGDVTFNGSITCTGISIYAGTSNNSSIHFRGAVTNSLGTIAGGTWKLFPTLRFYSSQNQFNGTSFIGAYKYIHAQADNVFNGLDAVSSGMSERGQLLLNGHDVTIGRVLCASATVASGHENQTVSGGNGATSVLRMRGGEDTVSNFRFVQNLSLVWDPTGDYTFTATSNRTSTLTGEVVVRRGTFALEGGHTMGSLSGVRVLSGATFKVAADSSINAAAVVRAKSGATLDVAGTVTVAGLKVDGDYLSAGDYSAGTYGGLTVAGAGTLHVTSQPGEEWETTQGVFYPYVYPLYVADIAASSSIDEVTFQKIESAGAAADAVPYADFVASARTGTIVKRGDGALTFDRDLSTFAGPVHVEDGVAIGVCSNCFGSATYDGSGTDNQRIYVHSGATLVMDAVGNKPARAEYNAVYYEGDGHPGMGGAYVFRNGETASGMSFWQSGVRSKAVGPTRIFIDFPSGGVTRITWDPHAEFSLGGQDVLMYGRTVGSTYGANTDPILDIGNLVISNMTMEVGGNSGELRAKNGSASTIRFLGGSRWIWTSSSDQTGQTATTFIDDLEYAQFKNWIVGGVKFLSFGVDPWGADGATKQNWYYGPMVLNDDFRMSNYYSPRTRGEYSWSYGCTFSGKVSGHCGFRQWYNENGALRGDAMRVNLLYPANTFEGGIVLSEGSLGVYGAKAVPSHEGAGIVSITNGYVYFGRKLESASVTNSWVNFTMPVTEFVNDGAVTNGTGVFKGLVKKGTGTLDYNSQMGGDYLDLQGGTVKFNTQYRSAYTGDNAAAAPDGYAAALPAFTTLKGTAGTLDLSDAGGSWTVANIEGSPAVSGNLTVTGDWAVDAAAIGNNVANISGTLTFGEGATVTVTGDPESVQRPQGGFVIARATSISGLPRLVGCKGWVLQASDGVLRLNKAGIIIIFR